MKLKLTLLLFFFAGLSVMAGPSSLFNVDDQKIQDEMATLQALEDHVTSNDLTLSEVEQSNPEYIAGLDLEVNIENIATVGDPPAGIPSFLWGFCLTWVGVILVYVISEDNEETKKALYGALAAIALYAIIWVILIIAGAF